MREAFELQEFSLKTMTSGQGGSTRQGHKGKRKAQEVSSGLRKPKKRPSWLGFTRRNRSGNPRLCAWEKRNSDRAGSGRNSAGLIGFRPKHLTEI